MSKELQKLAEPISKSGARLSEPEEATPLHPILQLQRLAGNHAVAQLFGSDDGEGMPGQVLTLTPSFGGRVQRKCKQCSATAKCAACEEEEIQRKSRSVSSLFFTHTIQRKKKPGVQRAANDGGAASLPGTETPVTEPTPSSAGPLIVADDADTISPTQMRKSEFLEQLRSTVCTTADAALAEAGQSTAGCPYIEQWLSYYSEQEPAHIERALRKYAPEANRATSAADYIPAVSNRVREAVQRWARTGELTGVPPELAGMLPGGGGVLGALAGIGSAVGGALSAVGSAIGGAFSSIGRALFKRKQGEAEDDEQQIQTELSAGQPLDAGANSRMSAAFGQDFSNVRVHTDAQAAGLSEQLNARAFTIGSDIAFGAGEYQPGTMIGDALLAHELAHVVQQHGGEAAISSKGEESNTSLEEEADVAAEEAVISIWGHSVPGVPRARPQSKLRRQAGLSLQRCGGGPSERELQTYLRVLDAGAIEAGEKSHERARAIARAWSRGGSPYVLTATRKRMLLRELMHGAVSDDDREAMLELLERSYNFELTVMINATMAADLDAVFSGSMLQVWLRLFFNNRFEGGSDTVLGGTATPIHPDLESPFAPISIIRAKGLPRPLGVGVGGGAMEGGSRRWNVPCLLGILCEQDRSVVDVMRTSTDFRSVDHFEIDEWRFKDGHWETWTRRNTLGINRSEEHLIVMRRDRNCAEAAETLLHEAVHQGQDPSVPWADREIEAYTKTEQLTIERGLPGRTDFRMTDPVTGAVVPNPAKIEEHVRGYPGLATPGETVIGKTDDGKTRVQRDDGSEFTRDPIEGDRFRIAIRRIEEETIDPAQWVCPGTT